VNLAALEIWALRTLAALALLGLAAWWIYARGEAHVQAKWDADKLEARAAEGVQSAKNKLESTNRQNAVDLAEAWRANAERELAAYRRSHPITGADLAHGLCDSAASRDSADACAGAGDGAAVAACKASGLLLAQGARDRAARELDALFAEADAINDSYAVCLATRPGAPHTAASDP